MNAAQLLDSVHCMHADPHAMAVFSGVRAEDMLHQPRHHPMFMREFPNRNPHVVQSMHTQGRVNHVICWGTKQHQVA